MYSTCLSELFISGSSVAKIVIDPEIPKKFEGRPENIDLQFLLVLEMHSVICSFGILSMPNSRINFYGLRSGSKSIIGGDYM